MTTQPSYTVKLTDPLVLIHGVVSFFYNALVVAVAFQVLQHAVAS